MSKQTHLSPFTKLEGSGLKSNCFISVKYSKISKECDRINFTNRLSVTSCLDNINPLYIISRKNFKEFWHYDDENVVGFFDNSLLVLLGL